MLFINSLKSDPPGSLALLETAGSLKIRFAQTVPEVFAACSFIGIFSFAQLRVNGKKLLNRPSRGFQSGSGGPESFHVLCQALLWQALTSILPILHATSSRSKAVCRFSPDSARIFLPSSTLVPSILTTTGTDRSIFLAA